MHPNQSISGGSRLLTPFSAFTRHRSLTWELTRRDVLGRYRGASFGMLWSLISPFLMLLIYTFAFGTVMQAKWPQAASGGVDFVIILFVGLIVHGFFAECLTRSPTLVTSHPNFVKKVIFPLDVLPWSMILSALFHTATNLLVFVLLHAALGGRLVWTMTLFPLVLLPLVILTVGLSWVLASVAVYFRDIGQVTGVASAAALFLSSALMPLDAVPVHLRRIFAANPITFIIDQARAVLLWGQIPDWAGLSGYLAVALLVCYAGHLFFEKTRRGFADVL